MTNSKSIKVSSFGAIGVLIFVVTAIYGYIANIIHLIGLDTFVVSGENIIRVVGIFIAPIGSIMGLFF